MNRMLGRISMGLCLLFVALLGLTSTALAQEPTTAATRRAPSSVARPTTLTPAGGCVTSDCHAGVKSYTYVHGPVAANDCESCHEVADASAHTFRTPRAGQEMCVYCHESPASNLPVVHKPVAQGECLACHNPHGGNSHASLREKNIADTCRSCHEDMSRSKSFLHAPVAQGACDTCHPPHASRFPKLLDVVGSDLCLSCHREMESPLAKAKFKHKALDEGCGKCHDVHGSNAPMSLVKSQPDLCYGCHDKLEKKIAAAAVPHSAVSTDRMCMNCHAPHASNTARLQKQAPASACLKCHNKAIKTDRGYAVAAVPEVADPKLHKHGEIKDGQCAGCHTLHAGDRRMLLKQPYNQSFHQPFSMSDYALCFTCHDVQLAKAQETTTATAFRNGNQNLHFVHANSGDRDKSCGTCHASHATGNDRLVRPTFRFGKRDLPIAFTRTTAGGGCAPGCHAAYAYDREKAIPIPKPTTQSATAPTSAPVVAALPRAEHDETRFVTWAAKDSQGASVEIPDPGHRATAVIILSASDPASLRLVDRIRRTLPAGSDARLVLLVVGQGTEKDIAALAAKAPNWPIILDSNGAATNSLDARVWPMALVLRPDGMELARVAGEPDFLATKLRAYLEVAAGRLTPSSAATQISAQPVAEASTAQQAARDIRAAELLLEQGKAPQAWAYLSDVKGTAPAVQLLRARVLVELKRFGEALTLLDRLPQNAVPSVQVDLIRASVLVGDEQWYLAKPLVEQLVAANPDLPATHLLLARIYEHERSWQKAAEQYRVAAESRKR